MSFSVCFLALEYFGWGKYGGIGRATRNIAEGLAQRGINTHVIVPKGVDQDTIVIENGVMIHSFKLGRYHSIRKIIREIDADIYHSQDPTPSTVLGMMEKPVSKHIMTCQNPKNMEDWKKVNKFYSLRRRLYNTLIEPYILGKIKELDAVYCQCHHIKEKAMNCYGLKTQPEFLPNPVRLLDKDKKSKSPQVCFLGRFDGEKNPERFFELAKKYPDINFVAAGKSHTDTRDFDLRNRFKMGNLDLPGHIEGENKTSLLESSWVLCNTSVSECLPVAFLEASSAGCSILSPHDPDGFASRFGYHVSNDYEFGLQWLFENDRWKERGQKGYEYVNQNHEYCRVIDEHIKVYQNLLY